MSGNPDTHTGSGTAQNYTLGKILYCKAEIRQAVQRIAVELRKELGGSELTFLIILKGGARFACDLMTAYGGPYRYDFITASSYGMELNSCGAVEFNDFNLARELIDSQEVVLVDDICDSGATFGAVAGRILAEYAPARLITCSLIWREGAGFIPDLWGFHCLGKEYLVGYGLGAGEEFRYLEDIRILEQD